MTHTNGRLQLDDAQPGDIRRYLLAESEGPPYFLASVPLDGQVPDAKAEANARRLVAAWNACEGSSTEWLEFQSSAEAEDAFGKLEPFETRYSGALLRGVMFMEQRDELLAALKHIEGAALDLTVSRHVISRAAHAAIAKVEAA